jgi:2-methylcitrate dehydratase PrpD
LSFLRNHIDIIVDPEAHKRGHYSSDMVLILKDGREYKASIDIPPGSVGNELAEEDFTTRFYDCVEFSGLSFFAERADTIFNTLKNFEKLESIYEFIDLFKGDNLTV